MSFLYGDKFKDYEIVKEIGSGGFGSVYMVNVYQQDKKITGALKVLHSSHLDDDKLVHRFHREARLASRIDCKWTPKIIDHGEYQGDHFILMEFAEGVTLKDFQNTGIIPDENSIFQDTTISDSDDETLMLDQEDNSDTTKTVMLQNIQPSLSPPYMGSEQDALTIIKQCAEVLRRSDEQKLIHRDIKPANILIRRDKTGNIESKLIDFGLAKCFIDNTLNISLQGQTMGTPAYMSPEQIRGEQPDIRSDIYSLGMTIYTFVTGRLPFKGEGPKEYLEQVMSAKLINPKKFNRSLSDDFINLLAGLTERDNRKRLQKPIDVVREADRILSSGGQQEAHKAVNVPGRKKMTLIVLFIIAAVAASLMLFTNKDKQEKVLQNNLIEVPEKINNSTQPEKENASPKEQASPKENASPENIIADSGERHREVQPETVVLSEKREIKVSNNSMQRERKAEAERKIISEDREEIVLSRAEREKLLLKKREELFRKNSKNH